MSPAFSPAPPIRLTHAHPIPPPRQPHASVTPCEPPFARRQLTETGGGIQPDLGPGFTEFDFQNANKVRNNLGGLCGLNCHPKLEDGDQIQYDRSTGLCTFTDTSKRDSEEKEQCDSGLEHEVYFENLGKTDSNHRVDLRVTNLTEYFPYNSNENGKGGVWAQINVQANHPVEFLFEFIDAVRTLAACAMPPAPL